MANSTYSNDNRSIDTISLILSLALAVAPWMLGYATDHAKAAASCFLGIVAAVCIISALSEHTRLFREVEILLGVLIAAAPWLLRFAGANKATAAHLIIGVIIAALSAGEVWFLRGPPPHRRS
jgi:hypothetical protein